MLLRWCNEHGFFLYVISYLLCFMLSHFSHVWLFATPWTLVHQAPQSIALSQQEYWSGLPFPPAGGLPNPGIKSVSPASPALAGGFFTTGPPWEALWVSLQHSHRREHRLWSHRHEFRYQLWHCISLTKLLNFLTLSFFISDINIRTPTS